MRFAASESSTRHDFKSFLSSCDRVAQRSRCPSCWLRIRQTCDARTSTRVRRLSAARTACALPGFVKPLTCFHATTLLLLYFSNVALCRISTPCLSRWAPRTDRTFWKPPLSSLVCFGATRTWKFSRCRCVCASPSTTRKQTNPVNAARDSLASQSCNSILRSLVRIFQWQKC